MSAPRPRRTLMLVRDRLRSMLPTSEVEVVPEGAEPPSRRGLAMLLSLVVALVMWFSFSMRETYDVTMWMAVEVVDTPSGTALRSPPPTHVTVTLEGEGWTLLSLARRTPTVQVSAQSSRINVREAVVQSGGLPSGIRVEAVQPQAIELALDTRTNRRLPIRLRQRIETQVGYDLLRPPRLSPDSVTVTGAQSLLGVLDSWPTELLVARDVEGSLTRVVALADTFGGLLSPSVRMTRVQIDVGEFTEARREIAVEVENLPPGVLGVRFDPPRVQATFRVPSVGDTYDRALSSTRVRAVVDYFDIARDTTATDGQVPVSARWPDDLDIRDVTVQPSRVGYFIQRPAVGAAVDGGE